MGDFLHGCNLLCSHIFVLLNLKSVSLFDIYVFDHQNLSEVAFAQSAHNLISVLNNYSFESLIAHAFAIYALIIDLLNFSVFYLHSFITFLVFLDFNYKRILI